MNDTARVKRKGRNTHVLLAFFLFISLLLRPFHLQAQEQTQVTLHVQNETVENVLSQLGKQTKLKFFYDQEVIGAAPHISITVTNAPLQTVLDKITAQTKLYFNRKNNTISVGRKKDRDVLQKSESKTITGKVVDAQTGEPVIGANVSLKNEQTGVITNINGEYSIEAYDGGTLVFSFIGYRSSEHAVGKSPIIDVKMSEDSELLSEVVVVGYRTQQKVNLSGSISTINMSGKSSETITDASQALYSSAGIWVNQSGSQPGKDDAKIRIRGVNSIGDSNPLVLLDGIEYAMNEIDPNDIESISVLKDASAAIYGSKASNGVILITSKKGEKGKTKIEYKGHFGIQQATALPDVVADPIMYMKMRNIAAVNSGSVPTYTRDEIREYEEGMKVDPSIYPASNWFDICLDNGFVQQHNVRLSGGSNALTYTMGVGFMDQDGVFIENDNAKRYSFDMKISAQVTPKLTVTSAITGNRRKFIEPGYGSRIVFETISRGLPIFSDYHKNGYYGSTWLYTPGRNNIENPRMQIEQGRIVRDYQELLARIESVYKLPLDISYNLTLAYRKTDRFSKEFIPLMQTIQPKTGDTKIFSTNSPRVKDWDANNYQFTISHRLTWEKTFAGKHRAHAMAGQDYYIYRNRNFQAYNKGFLTSDLSELSTLTDYTYAQTTGGSSRDLLNSFYSRLEYVYNDKYTLEGTFRYDGSSRFRKANQWNFYPSVLMGWRVDQEEFFKSKYIDGLKLRASIGTMGNQTVPMYSYKAVVKVSDKSNNYNYSFGGKPAGGAAVAQIIDDNITWESTTSYNIGVDLVAFKNRLSFTGDLFYKRTKNILRKIDIPDHIGGLDGPNTNVGVVDNKGYELGIAYRDRKGSFSYGANLNLTYIKNKVIDLNGEEYISGTTLLREGHPIDSYYVLEADGYFQSYDEIRQAEAVYGSKTELKPGYIKYKNQNGDNIIDEKDKIVAGNPIPTYTYSFGLNLGYKNFTFEAQFQGVQDVDVYPMGNIVFPFNNGAGVTKDWATDSWTPENRNASNPLLTTLTDAPENFVYSTHWIRDASYLRMKNIQLSYNLPEHYLKAIGLQKVQVYVSGQNLVTFTNFKLWDPEISNKVNHLGEYPTLKTFSCGINLSF